jgi:hypothetical protein
MTKNFSNGEGRKGVGEATARVSSGQKKKNFYPKFLFLITPFFFGTELSFIFKTSGYSRRSIDL